MFFFYLGTAVLLVLFVGGWLAWTRAHRLEFEVTLTPPQGDTGNTHYAERLEVASGRGRRLVLETDMEAGVLAPLIDRQVRLGPGWALLLGWSSWGGGMQTVQALVVSAGSEGVTLQDRLRFTTDRPSAGVLLVTRWNEVRIGLPEPGKQVKDPDDWELCFGGARRDLAAIRALRYAARADAGQDASFYCPPLRTKTPAAGSRFAWVLVDESGFRLAEAAQGPKRIGRER
jgi:hypothetical protein